VAFEAYPLFGFKSGLRTDREPWLVPEDAFTKIENASLFKGRMTKRPTSRAFASLGTKVIGKSLGTNAAGQLCGNTSGGSIPGAPLVVNLSAISGATLPLVQPTVTPADKPVTFSLPPYSFRIVGPAVSTNIYNLEWYAGTALTQPYTAQINVATGRWFVQLTAADAFTVSAVTVTFEFYRRLPAMLITEWVNAAGVRELVVCDTRRLFVWNAARNRFDDKSAVADVVATDDVWSGSSTDFFSAASVDDGSSRKLVIVNGVNLPKKWDGAAFASMGVSSQLTAAHMVFAQYGYVIYLAPTVAGAVNRQRAMWSDQFLTETVQPSNFAVAYTGERFVTAAMVNDEILCFFDRAVWKIRYTGDFRAPFEWVHIAGGTFDRADNQGGISRTGIVALDDRAIALGPHGVVQANGTQAQEASPQVPDIMTQFLDPAKLSISYGVAFDQQREVWFSVASSQASTSEPDRTLVVSTETGAVSLHTWSYRVFGIFRKQDAVPAWDDVQWATTLMRNVTAIPAASQNLAGFPTVLAGDLLGNLYEIPSADVFDVLGTCKMILHSKRLNPYVTTGDWQEALLGWWLIYMDPSPGQSLIVRLYRDNSPAPYAEYTIPLDATAGESKLVKRIQVNRAARWHEIELEYESDVPWAADAVVAHFSPAGEIQHL
jgi:hypothetical protein